ncbi:hypothetical protein FXO38_28059 [Capsicum annuum]|nr:hypothetical protein FXO38_28059 [Capsicum annuum]
MTEILKNKRMKKTDSPKEQKTKKYEKKRKAKEIEEVSKDDDNDIQNSYAEESEEDSEDEIKGSSSSAIVIRSNGTNLHFTPREFSIVTDLNFIANRDKFIFDDDVPNRLVEKYFNGAEFIQKRQLFIAFMNKVWGENNNEDVEKFAILYFLHSFVLSNVDTVVIPRLHFYLEDSKRYKNFSWDTLSFEDLARSLNNRLKAGGKFYLTQELSLAIQVWLYECSSNIPKEIASEVDNQISRLLNWKTNAPQSRFEYLMNSMFNDDGKEQFADKQAEQSNVDDGGLKKSGQHFSVDVVQSSNNIIDVTKQQNANKDSEMQHMGFASAEISPQLFSLNVDNDLGENLNGTKTSDEKMYETILSDSQLTISNEILPNLNAYRRESIVKLPSKNCEEESHYENLNDKKAENVVEDQFKGAYSYSYEFSGHYAAVLAEVEQLTMIIPLCLQACDFYVKKGIDLQNLQRYKDKDSSDMFDVLFEDNLPQQSGSLDCGLYTVTYAECLLNGDKVSSIEFNPNALHRRYVALLWDYGIRKQEANAHSDFETPLRFVRQSRITSVIEVLDV